MRRNLTLNLGVRWDYSPPVFEPFDRQASWDPTVIDPASGLPGAYTFAGNCAACTGKGTFGKRDFNNFAPRVGFAWQAMSSFTVRGSFTVQYLGDNSGLASDIVGNGSYNLNADPVFPGSRFSIGTTASQPIVSSLLRTTALTPIPSASAWSIRGTEPRLT